MKRIKFNTLIKLFNNVEMYNKTTFPIRFKSKGKYYEIGIGMYDTDIDKDFGINIDTSNFFCGFNDYVLQYIAVLDFATDNDFDFIKCFKYVEDNEAINSNLSCEIIKKCCNINNNGWVTLLDDISFTGETDEIYYNALDDTLIEKETSCPCGKCVNSNCEKCEWYLKYYH